MTVIERAAKEGVVIYLIESRGICGYEGVDIKNSDVIPDIRPPHDSTSGRGSFSSGGNRHEISTFLNSPLELTEILAHYKKELEAQNWATVGAPKHATVSPFEHLHKSWQGFLAIVPTLGDEYQVTFIIVGQE